MADVTFNPLGNRIVVEPSEEEASMSAGGIYIPDTAKAAEVVRHAPHQFQFAQPQRATERGVLVIDVISCGVLARSLAVR